MEGKIIPGELNLSGEKYAGYYIVQGADKTALIDTVPEEAAQELSRTLADVRLDYIVFTSTDSRRAGALEKLLAHNNDAEVIATVAGLRNLHEILNADFKERTAKDSQLIDLGGISLEIMVTPRLSWPDTMMVYIPEKKALMSGMMFDTGADDNETRSYFVRNFGSSPEFVKNAIERVRNKDIVTLYSSGGICSSEPSRAIDAYSEILRGLPQKNGRTAVIIYAGRESGYTAQLSETVANTMAARGYSTEVINCVGNVYNAADAANRADVLCFASPTVNRRAIPELMDVISRLDAMSMKRTPCIVTGSYGWGGEALGTIASYLKLMGMKVFEKPFGTVFKPSGEDRAELEGFVNRFIEEIKEYDNNQ